MNGFAPAPGPATAPTAAPLPPPTERNRLWRSLQLLLQSLFVIAFRYRARGIEKLPASGALLLINHQSFLDPAFVGLPLRRPVSYVARENLLRTPLLGWFLRNTYVMPINRDSASTAGLREAVRRMQHGFLVGIFPEGTRSRDASLGRLKPGFIALVRRGGVPVHPVGIAGGAEILPRGACFPRPRSVRVVIGDPLTADELACLHHRGREHELVETARRRIEACIREAQAWRASQ